ncbi:unnamed protein product [Protopolystoma xenopodis]|uniref:Prenyltransferase alpha-alpha toroid domain-containing protein n=1 Tax=Protopolystoma xenopodis TaxID=117903 RepID=A0A3S5CV12_9PLAT|nr:unnamed protein product [Protopolystoma xenopodis]
MDNLLNKYFRRITEILPENFQAFDTFRVLILFFGVNGLDIMDALETVDKQVLIDWVYSNQIISSSQSDDRCGFRGSNCISGADSLTHTILPYDGSHSTAVYTSLCCLLALGDDLSRLNRPGIIRSLAALQIRYTASSSTPGRIGIEESDKLNAESVYSGCFRAGNFCGELDARFVFSSIASLYILDALKEIDTNSTIAFITRCLKIF